MPAYRTVEDIFLGDIEFWTRPIDERHAAFAALRAETRRGGGMCFHEEVSVLEGNEKGHRPGRRRGRRHQAVRRRGGRHVVLVGQP